MTKFVNRFDPGLRADAVALERYGELEPLGHLAQQLRAFEPRQGQSLDLGKVFSWLTNAPVIVLSSDRGVLDQTLTVTGVALEHID